MKTESNSTNDSSHAPNKNLAQTILRAFQVLDAFEAGRTDLSLKDITALADLNKTVVARILNTLVHLDLVSKSESARTYRLGPRLFEYGSRFISQLDLRKLALPYMTDIMIKTMDTVYLMIRSNDEALMVERVKGGKLGSLVGTPIGGRLPLHVGAAPMMILVGMSDSEISEWAVRTGLPRLGEHTVQDVGTLLKQVKKIRQDEYHIAREDPTPGVVSVGAPVYDHKASIIAGLSVGLLSPRFEKCNQAMYIELITEAAQKLSRDMGYSG
ncbi:MAG: IclR family transcriptional regulator [Thermodesulfobacteriota bacterium]